MTKYRIIGKPYAHPHAGLVEGHSVGDELDADFSEEEERGLAGAGVLERIDGGTLQPDPQPSGAESMDAPPHTADPGVGFMDVPDRLVGAEAPAESESTAEEQPEG